MKEYQYYLLCAAVFLAPRMDQITGCVLGVGAMVMAVVIAWSDE